MSVDLEARLRRLEDRVELRDLTIRYCAAQDDRDIDGVLAMFTAGGTFRHDDGNANATGHDEIRGYFTKTLKGMGPSLHIPHTQLLEFQDDDHATGVVQSHAEMALRGEAVWAAMRYHDEYVREDGCWKFAKRVLRFWYLMPLADLPKGLAGDLRRTFPGDPIATQLPETLETWKRFYGTAE